MFYSVASIGNEEQRLNAGFVRTAYLIDNAQLLGLLDPVRFKNALPGMTVPANGLTVINGVTLTKLERVPLLGVWEEQRGESAQGETFQPTFNFELPQNTPELLAWLMTTTGRRYVVLWEDRNGYAHITGTEDTGLRLSYKRSITDANGLSLQLTAQMPTPTWGLQTLELTELLAESDFSFEFSLYFNA